MLVDKFWEIGIKVYVLPSYPLTVYPKPNSLESTIKFPVRLAKMLVKRERGIWNFNKVVKEIKPDIIHTNVGTVSLPPPLSSSIIGREGEG